MRGTFTDLGTADIGNSGQAQKSPSRELNLPWFLQNARSPWVTARPICCFQGGWPTPSVLCACHVRSLALANPDEKRPDPNATTVPFLPDPF